MKYLLEAPDEEMAEWKAAAKEAGVKFAEWLRQLAREGMRSEADQREPVAVRGGYQPLAAGPPPTVPPPKPSDAHKASPVTRVEVVGAKVFKGPDPRPSGKKR